MGNGRPKKPLFPGLESQANAHNEDEDTPDCTTVGADQRGLLRNRLTPGVGIYVRDKRK
jgi:hypothetical protein